MFSGNPILKREFSASARSLKTNLLLWGYLILLSATLLALWPSGGVLSLATDSAKKIFAMFFGVDLALLILLTPAFAATAITAEKENDTFPALFVTLLSPFEIMWGKLSASIATLLFLALFSIPIAAVCALTGGIGPALTFKVVSVIVLAAVSYGMAGLACSALFSRSSTAIVANYILILLFAGATWLPAALLGDLIGFQNILQTIRSFSPFDALFYLIYPETYGMSTQIETSASSDPYWTFAAFSIALSVLSFLVFSRKIFHHSAKKGKALEMYEGRKKAIKRKLTWPFYLFDPLKRKKNIGRWSNPVFVAEMRNKLFANPKFVMRTVSAVFILSLGILWLVSAQYAVNFDPDTVRVVAVVFQLGVVALLAPGVSSGLITDELAAGTIVPMRMTLITPVKMIMGKLKATFFYALIFILSGSAVICVIAYLQPQNVFPDNGSILDGAWWSELSKMMKQPGWFERFWTTYHRVAAWVAILLLSSLAFLSAGLFASSVSKTTGVATAVAYSITAAICLASFAPVVLGTKLAHGFSAAVLAVNPVAAAMQAISSNAFSEYPEIWKANIWVLGILTLLFLGGATARVWRMFNKMD